VLLGLLLIFFKGKNHVQVSFLFPKCNFPSPSRVCFYLTRKHHVHSELQIGIHNKFEKQTNKTDLQQSHWASLLLLTLILGFAEPPAGLVCADVNMSIFE
jgi:hypothetical protein